MFISPKTAIDNGWIIHPDAGLDWKKHIQPNAIDFTLDRAFVIGNATHPFVISESKKHMRGTTEIFSTSQVPGFEGGFFEIRGNTVIDGMSNFHVTIPEGVAALLIVRSTLNRNGLFITSGLYDSGFQGSIGVAIHNNHQSEAYIAAGTRVGQIIFVESQNVGMYSGQWNHAAGTHYSEKK